mmetsp:Transcript_24758/g.53282  ORF Transcript_24758/g.53282 Transcript_24758/m.53282 type:complete len:455 (-) Transcript_24758:15-1379(-)
MRIRLASRLSLGLGLRPGRCRCRTAAYRATPRGEGAGEQQQEEEQPSSSSSPSPPGPPSTSSSGRATGDPSRLFVEGLVPREKASRLDTFLSSKLPDLSRARIQESVRAGTATVNGTVQLKPAFKVQPGDEVVCRIVERPPLNVDPEDIPLDVVYEDAHLLVIDKPAGLVTHPAPGNHSGTLVNAVLHHCNLPSLDPAAHAAGASLTAAEAGDADEVGDDDGGGRFLGGGYRGDVMYGTMPVPRPGIVHRLDKGTSGLIVVAKDDLARESLQSQFKDRTVEREYLSLLCGHIRAPWGTVEGRVVTAIGRDRRERIRMAAYPLEGLEHKPHLKRAASNYSVMEVFANGGASLVAWRLDTGRTHQIRVHAKHLGNPLVGDVVYGGTAPRLARSMESGRVSPSSAKAIAAKVAKTIDRPALHAATLGFDHPKSGERMRFSSNPPLDFEECIAQLRKL